MGKPHLIYWLALDRLSVTHLVIFLMKKIHKFLLWETLMIGREQVTF